MTAAPEEEEDEEEDSPAPPPPTDARRMLVGRSFMRSFAIKDRTGGDADLHSHHDAQVETNLAASNTLSIDGSQLPGVASLSLAAS